MAKIYATYSAGCFCERPELTAEVETPMEPTFKFAKAAKILADKLGAVNFQLNKRGSGRSAYAELPCACNHREHQPIRFDWRCY